MCKVAAAESNGPCSYQHRPDVIDARFTAFARNTALCAKDNFAARAIALDAIQQVYQLLQLHQQTRTVPDNALLLAAIAGHDPDDPGSARLPVPDFTADLDKGVKGLKIGVILCEALYGRQARASFNLTGNPALAIPTGFAASGLPLSMQIIGKPFDEITVYRVARAYERAADWISTHPDLG